MGNLLISEPPLQVLPSLAVKVGLNEAIVLQQFHYWLQRSRNVRDGEKWIYNSIDKWLDQFPFWSRSTLKRTLTSLEDSGYLITGNFNQAGFDKTKWYRIDYSKLVSQPLGQNDPTSGSKRPNGVGQNDPTNTNRLPENTTETNKNHSPAEAEQFPWEAIIDYLNEKTGKHFRHIPTNKQIIMARHKEGATAEDMRLVVDNQCALWLNDSKMNRYLQPSTLFRASKFEGYLNQVPVNGGQRGGSYDGIDY